MALVPIFEERRDKRGEDARGMNGGTKRRQRIILEKLWQKSCRKQGGRNGVREPHSRSQGNIGEADQEVGMLGRRWETPGWADDLVQ